jgi:hypothetical protein
MILTDQAAHNLLNQANKTYAPIVFSASLLYLYQPTYYKRIIPAPAIAATVT